jgi:carbamoyl-phosphate synthase large subunit
VVDAIKNGEIQLVINTSVGGETRRDGYYIRRTALKHKIPYATTIAGGTAICTGIMALKNKMLSVKTVQEYNNM